MGSGPFSLSHSSFLTPSLSLSGRSSNMTEIIMTGTLSLTSSIYQFTTGMCELLRQKNLTVKAPPIICGRQQFQILLLFQNNKYGMIFHENRRIFLKN